MLTEPEAEISWHSLLNTEYSLSPQFYVQTPENEMRSVSCSNLLQYSVTKA